MRWPPKFPLRKDPSNYYYVELKRFIAPKPMHFYYSDEYNRLLPDFEANGNTWTTQQLRYFFNIGQLELDITYYTQFNFNFDYKNPTTERFAQQDVIDVIYELWDIIKIFGIKMPAHDVSQITDSYMPLAEWLAEAAEWVENVIRPLLDKLKKCETLSRIGGELVRIHWHRNKLLKEYEACKVKAEQSSSARNIYSEYHQLDHQNYLLNKSAAEIIHRYLEDIKEFIRSKEKPHQLKQIKAEIIHLFPKVQNIDYQTRALIDIQQNEQSGAPYLPETMPILRIKSKCGFELLAYGVIFLAQQELDRAQDQQPVLTKIATLISEINKPDLERMIREFRFSRTDFLNYLDDVVEAKQSSHYFLVHKLAAIFRQILAKHQLTYLVNELKAGRSTLDNPIWLEILQIFWNYYDKSALEHNSYFLFDKTIQKNISNAAEKIKRLEQESGETYIEKNGRPIHLKAGGFWRLIAHMLVNIHVNRMKWYYDRKRDDFDDREVIDEGYIKHYNINEYLFNHGYYLFLDLKIADLETMFLLYYSRSSGSDSTLSSICANTKFSGCHYVKAATEYIKHQPAEIREALVNHSHNPKECTPQMLQLLQAHLAADPRFGIVRRDQLHNDPQSEQSFAVRMLQHVPSLFVNNSNEAKTIKGAMELKSFNPGYGTFAASSSSTTAAAIKIDEDAVLHYQATEENIVTLAKQLLHIRVIFHNQPQREQPMRINVERPVLHLYALSSTDMYLFIDPFPKSTHIISPKLTALAFINTAHLTKEEIFAMYNSYIPSDILTTADNTLSAFDNTTRLMIHICKMCQEQNTTVVDVLNYIKTNMPAKKGSSSYVYFMNSIDYLFYRFYGKSFAEVVATTNVSVVIQEVRLEEQRHATTP